jgi:hypothetical protein
VFFLQWTVSGSNVAGALEEAALSADGAALVTESSAVAGTISGTSVTLHTKILSSSGAVSGTLQGSDLLLAIPQTNGSLATVRFSPGTAVEYNLAVAPLRASAQRTNLLDEYVEDVEAQVPSSAAGLMTDTFQTASGLEAVVSYPSEDLAFDDKPVMQVLAWANGEWTSRATFDLPGAVVGTLVALHIAPGAQSFASTATPGAGDNLVGAVISNFGGRWHVVTFDTPQGRSSVLVSPVFTSGADLTMQQIGDAGGCVAKTPYRFDPKEDAFVVAGPITNNYESGTCQR